MAEVKNISETKKEAETAVDEETIVKLSKPYTFEGETISEIDFSGLEDISANDMIKANKVLATSGQVTVLPENDLLYCLIIASNATKYPVEFYKALKPRDAIKVKNKVTSFFFGEE
jgi:hypothetical protein